MERRIRPRRNAGHEHAPQIVVRTDAVVANSVNLQTSAAVSAAMRALSLKTESDASRQSILRASAAVAERVAQAYGDKHHVCGHPSAFPDAELDEKERAQRLARYVARDIRNREPGPATARPTHEAYTLPALRRLVVANVQLAELCRSFATLHRAEANVENDVHVAIGEAVDEVHEAYAQVDDEVLRHQRGAEWKALEHTVRWLNRRASQLKARAARDAHGEVFASHEFAATLSSFVDASKIFNAFCVGTSLLDVDLADRNAQPARVANEGLAADGHARLATELEDAARMEPWLTSAAARARGHRRAAASAATAASEGLSVLDPLDDAASLAPADQPLVLATWIRDALDSASAEFMVLQPWSVSASGELQPHAVADTAEFLTLCAKTTSTIACHAVAPRLALLREEAVQAAWSALRHARPQGSDAFYRPCDLQMEHASGLGIVAHDRREGDHPEVVTVDVARAKELYDLRPRAATASASASVALCKLAPLIGYMFSTSELEHARRCTTDAPWPSRSHEFAPHTWTEHLLRLPVLQATSIESRSSLAPLAEGVEYAAECASLASASDAHAVAMRTCAAVRPQDVRPARQDSTPPSASPTTTALMHAVSTLLRTSVPALDALSGRISERSGLVDHTAGPSIDLYASLKHRGERSVDVAASLLGMQQLPQRDETD